MQARPTPDQTDPHDISAIETLLAAHADKAPPLVHDPVGPAAQAQPPALPPEGRAPEIKVDAPSAEITAAPRAADVRGIADIDVGGIRVEKTGPADIAPLAEPPSARWVKPVALALLGLCGAIGAAAWQHYGDHARAMAAGWAPPFVLAALSSPDKASDKPAAGQDGAPAPKAAMTEQPATRPAQPEPAVAAAASAEAAQMQSMARDLAAMGQQLEALKAAIAQLKASQDQTAREVAKASENRAAEARAEARPTEPRPRVTAATPPRPA
uniref:hypothetical protein n=1 Tax=Bradyrhizobium sp. TaxID=376 RepID=UPI0025C31583